LYDALFESAWNGCQLVFAWPNILYPLIGTAISMTYAVIPGLSGSSLMALVIPFTFSWSPLQVMLVFGALVGGSTFMGSVTSILFNIPGKSSNAATMIDGYPLTRLGRAREALGCAAVASACGSTLGIVILILMIPLMQKFLLLFGPLEMLALAIWGLSTIAAFTEKSAARGLAAAGVGLMLGFVGYDPRTAEARYTFGLPLLYDGLDVVSVFLGLFALTEIIDLEASGQGIITSPLKRLSGRTIEGAISVFRHFWLFVRSSIIGTFIGMLPGVGAAVAAFAAYGHAVQTSKGKRMFGRGDIRGVLAPEAANDAKDGGALVPTLAFGIPGGMGTAMLLAVFNMHGIVPGRSLLTDQLELVFVLIGALFFSNILTSAIGLAIAEPLARLTRVKTHFIVPGILILASAGAYMHRGLFFDLAAAYAFGVIGYFMKRSNWPRLPLVIALVLTPLFESNLNLTIRLYQLGRIDLFSHPVAAALLALTLVSLGLQLRKNLKNRS
jgi:TctA family transporter